MRLAKYVNDSGRTRRRFTSAQPAGVSVLALLLAVLGLFGCSKGAMNAHAPSPAGGDYRSELDALSAPQGADGAVWEAIKSQLFAALDEKYEGDPSRAASAAPMGDAGKVADLSFDDETSTLSWSYVNLGDYDLSGTVGVPDITPIALNYLSLVSEGPPILDWIDGDGNGEIGIPDITPIALGYLNEVAGYEILTSDSSEGPWDWLGTAAYPETPEFPVEFEFTVESGGMEYFAVRPFDSQDGLGELSVIVSVSGNIAPVANLSAFPMEGEAPLTVEFDASDSYDPDGDIVKYEWDFDGDGTYDLDSGLSPMTDFTYTSGGTFNAKVRVTDGDGATGTDTVEIQVTNPDNQFPEAQITFEPNPAEVDETVNFDASGSTDPDGVIVKYEWDWTSDGIYDMDTGDSPYAEYAYTEQGFFDATVRVTDDEGASSTAVATVTVIAANVPPVAVLIAMQEGPTSASFDASGSIDPDGEIVLFEWDWTSDGTYDEDTGDLPYTSHDYGSYGAYTATVRVTDDRGGTATAEATVTLIEPHTWNIVIPAGEIGTHAWSSTAIIDGKPAFSYVFWDDGTTQYVTALDPLGATWGASTQASIDRGNTALLEVLGAPSIAWESSGSNTRYVRASNPGGSMWETEVVADSTSGTGRMLSAGFVYTTDMFPAIASANWSNNNLYFLTAADTAGDTWNASIVVANDVGQCFPSLHYVETGGDKYPAISFFDRPNQSLMFMRASDTAGSAWEEPVVVDSSVGSWFIVTTLLIVNGNPAILYYDGDTEDAPYNGVMIAAASDPEGQTWSEFHSVSGADVASGRALTMGFVAGELCAAYSYYAGGGDEALGFRKLTGPGLGGWSPRELVDDGFFYYANIVDAAGLPGVGYLRSSPDPSIIKYAYRTTP